MPTLRTSEAELHFEVAGPETAETVVLLHGLGSSSADWLPQIEALRDRYQVVALDARGSGGSRDLVHPRGPFSVKTFASDVAALLAHLGVASAHVVGLSMGGMIAFQLAVDEPRLVRTLTIVNSFPALVARTPREALILVVRRFIARAFGPRGMGRIMAPLLFPKPEQEHLRQAFRDGMARNDKGAYIATQKALIGWSVLDRIASITAPTLVVAADRDYTPVSDKEAYAGQMKNAKVVVVQDARHALPAESPAKFNAVLLEFLSSEARAATGRS